MVTMTPEDGHTPHIVSSLQQRLGYLGRVSHQVEMGEAGPGVVKQNGAHLGLCPDTPT